MRILILSFYYYPDLCAGSFRCTALVEKLQKYIDDSSHLEVITTVPNRYASFNISAPACENYPKLTIQRLLLPRHKSGMLDQAKAYFYFYKQVKRLTKDKSYDIVFATSSRLMTAFLGALIARKKNAKLYLDIRDIFSDIIRDIIPKKIAYGLTPLFKIIEKWTFNQAFCINIISQGFKSYFTLYYPKTKLRYFTNGIDKDFIDLNVCNKVQVTAPITVLYAGNIGEGQGLHRIIPDLAQTLATKIHFKIIGDGGRKSLLEENLLSLNCGNVSIFPPMSRQDLIKEYLNADVLFLHLNDYPAFEKVLPSKVFEYGALGLPIWAGVKGYAAEFVRQEINNAEVFAPCNLQQAIVAFNRLEFNKKIDYDFIKKYARDTIMESMAKDILSLYDNK